MKFTTFILFTFLSLSLWAQEPQKVTVKMSDGATYTGTIKEKSEEFLILTTSHGELKLNINAIQKIEEENYTGEFAYANPHYTRYYFAPSARPLDKGDGYYQNLMIFGNFINVGVTKNISLGGGFEFISLLAGGTPIIFLTPKVGFKVAEKTHVGTGTFLVGVPNDFGNSGGMTFAGVVYGSATRGTKDAHLTVGVGYGVADGNWAQYPVINFNGFVRASKSIGLMTENYFIPAFDLDDNGVVITMFGFRIMGRKSAFDLGIVGAFDEGVAPIPYVGYAVAF